MSSAARSASSVMRSRSRCRLSTRPSVLALLTAPGGAAVMAGRSIAGLIGQLGHRWRQPHVDVVEHQRGAELVPKRPRLLSRIELHPYEDLARVLNPAQERVPLGRLLATQRIRVELLLERIEISLEHPHKKRHRVTSWSVCNPAGAMRRRQRAPRGRAPPGSGV